MRFSETKKISPLRPAIRLLTKASESGFVIT
jgi:hypothetical protein